MVGGPIVEAAQEITGVSVQGKSSYPSYGHVPEIIWGGEETLFAAEVAVKVVILIAGIGQLIEMKTITAVLTLKR